MKERTCPVCGSKNISPAQVCNACGWILDTVDEEDYSEANSASVRMAKEALGLKYDKNTLIDLHNMAFSDFVRLMAQIDERKDLRVFFDGQHKIHVFSATGETYDAVNRLFFFLPPRWKIEKAAAVMCIKDSLARGSDCYQFYEDMQDLSRSLKNLSTHIFLADQEETFRFFLLAAEERE